MIGDLNKDKDEERIKNKVYSISKGQDTRVEPLPIKQNTQQRLQALAPDTRTRTTADGYTVTAPAGEASKFFAPTGKGDPVAEKNWDNAHEQFLAREQSKQRPAFSTSNAPAVYKPDFSTWGWNARDRAFKMNQEASASAAANATAQRGQDISAQTSRRGDTLQYAGARESNATQRQATEYARESALERNKIDAANSVSGQQRDSAASDVLKQQALTSADERASKSSQRGLDQEIIDQTYRIANAPSLTPQERLQALERTTVKPMTEYEDAKIRQGDDENFNKFVASMPPGTPIDKIRGEWQKRKQMQMQVSARLDSNQGSPSSNSGIDKYFQ